MPRFLKNYEYIQTLLAIASVMCRLVTPAWKERTQHGSNYLLVFRQILYHAS